MRAQGWALPTSAYEKQRTPWIQTDEKRQNPVSESSISHSLPWTEGGNHCCHFEWGFPTVFVDCSTIYLLIDDRYMLWSESLFLWKIYFCCSSEIKLNLKLRLTLELIKRTLILIPVGNVELSTFDLPLLPMPTIRQDFTRHVLLTFFYNHILVHETVTGSRLHKIHYTVLL